MDLQGKKVVFLGDSITEGFLVAPGEVYHALLKRRLGLREAVNLGVGGTRFARQKEHSAVPAFDLDFNLRVQTVDADADLVVVFGGTNDYGHGLAPFGTLQDEGVYTFCGACRTLFSRLKAAFPRVLCVTPLHRVGEEDPRGDGSKKGGPPLREYVAVIRAVAGELGIPVADLWNEAGLDPNAGAADCFADGLHPNAKGHGLIAAALEGALLAL